MAVVGNLPRKIYNFLLFSVLAGLKGASVETSLKESFFDKQHPLRRLLLQPESVVTGLAVRQGDKM